MLQRFAAAAPLRRRDFRLFWIGQFISQLGDNIHLVALNWLTWQLTGSGAALATITLCATIPSVAMMLVGGAVVDRFSRRLMTIWSDLIRGAILLGAAGLQVTGILQVWHLYVVAAIFGFVSAFARPAFRALLQSLVQADDLVAANGLMSAGSTAAGVAGPALGGLIMALGGASLAFALDGISFLVAAFALLSAHPIEPPRVTTAGPIRLKCLLTDMREAVRLLAGQPFLLGTIGAMSLIIVTGQGPIVLLRAWVAEQTGGGVQALSLSYSFFAAGMFLTVTLLTGLKVRRHRELLIYLGMAVAGLGEVGFAHVAAPWQMWLLDFGLGISVMVHGVVWPALLQERIPAEAMGRVAAIDQFGMSILYPAGVALIGVLSVAPGPGWTLALGGWLTFAVAVAGGLFLVPVNRPQPARS